VDNDPDKAFLDGAIRTRAAELHRALTETSLQDTERLLSVAHRCADTLRALLVRCTMEDDEALEALVNVCDQVHWFVGRVGPNAGHPMVIKALTNAHDVVDAAVNVLTRWRPSAALAVQAPPEPPA
jgi:hypothetical protein